MVDAERNKIFDTLKQNMEMVSKQLSSEDAERSGAAESYNKDEFWKKIVDLTRQVSFGATKMCLLFSKPPLPDAASCEALCQSLGMSCLSLLSVFYGFPSQQGVTLRKQLKDCILNIIQSICFFIEDLRASVSKSKNNQLQATGSVWDVCEKLEHAPRDNKAAVLKIISSHSELVDDALQELTEAVNEAACEEEDDDKVEGEECDSDAEMNESWTSSEVDVARTSMGLVKTAKACTKKSTEVISNQASATDSQQNLDAVAVTIERLTPAVDEFVSSLYPPMRRIVVMENAVSLSVLLKELLDVLRTIHCFTAEDTAWHEFLCKAVDHNLAKVENLTGKSRLG